MQRPFNNVKWSVASVTQLKNQPFFLRQTDTERACLLLHGLGAGTYEFQLLGQHLHQQGLTVQAILYPGHDQPSTTMPDSTWPDWYAAIETTYHQLRQHYREIFVVGFSTGCPLGLHLASQYPIAKLVCLCPYLSLKQPWYSPLPLEVLVNTIGQLLPEVPRLGLPIRDPALKSQANAAKFYRSFNLVAVRSAMDLIATVKPKLPEITIPTLIMQSRLDSIVDTAGAVYLLERLGSVEKQLLWCEKSDHIVTLDYDRDFVAQAVTEFLVG